MFVASDGEEKVSSFCSMSGIGFVSGIISASGSVFVSGIVVGSSVTVFLGLSDISGCCSVGVCGRLFSSWSLLVVVVVLLAFFHPWSFSSSESELV